MNREIIGFRYPESPNLEWMVTTLASAPAGGRVLAPRLDHSPAQLAEQRRDRTHGTSALINGKYQQITDPKADRLSRVSGINNNQVIVGTGYNGGNPPTISHGLFIVNGQVKEI
jgi:hypothetical protein